MLNVDSSLLLLVDVQEKLVNMLSQNTIIKTSAILAKTANILGVETIVTEQYPKGLGDTITPVKEVLNLKTQYYEKTSFSALGDVEIADAIDRAGKKQIIICGIEAHICVYQTAMDLLEKGYEVYFVADASASRKKLEFKTAVELLRQAGAKITCVEIVLFELLKSAKNPNFKEVQALIK